jgi:hypothetical protein
LIVQINRKAYLERFILLFIKILIVFNFFIHRRAIIGYFAKKINCVKLFRKNLLTTIINFSKL